MNVKESAILTLKHRNYTDYERLMIQHITNLYQEIQLIEDELNLKISEAKSEIQALANIQAMLLKEDSYYKYWDIANKMEKVYVTKKALSN